MDPLLYAVKKAIGPRQLTEEEARNPGWRAYTRNSSLSSGDIGKAIGRSIQTVDAYTDDLRAAVRQDKDLKIFCMNRLGIPQDRITKRLGIYFFYHSRRLFCQRRADQRWWGRLFLLSLQARIAVGLMSESMCEVRSRDVSLASLSYQKPSIFGLRPDRCWGSRLLRPWGQRSGHSA